MSTVSEELDLERDDRTLEEHLVDQLFSPEGAMELYKHRFREEFIPEEDEGVRKLLRWVFDYIEQYGQAPAPDRILEEFEIPYDEPGRPVEDLVAQFKSRYRVTAVESVWMDVSRITRANSDQAIERALSELQRIRSDTAEVARRFSNEDLVTAYDEQKAREAITYGVTTGFPEIDVYLNGGIKDTWFTMIVGRLGTYKSWFMLKSAVGAMLQGRRAIFFPLEMGEEEMIQRELAMLMELSWHGWQNGAYDDVHEMRENVAALKDELTQGGEYGDLIWYSPDSEQYNMRDLLAIAKEHEADVIYIDQLEDMMPTDAAFNRVADWERLGEIVREMKQIGKHERIPVVCAHQFSRAAMASDVTCLADLESKVARSDSIMKRADLALAIWRDKSLNASGMLQYGIIKSRQFEPTGWECKVNLNVNANIKLMSEMTKDDYYGQ